MAVEEIILQAAKRTETGTRPARRLRAEGKVPAVVYGHGKNAVLLVLDAKDLHSYIHHTGLIKLDISGRKRDVSAVIKDIQLDSLRGEIKHVDFQEVRADEVITATVPLESHGTPAGEQAGGMLEQILHEVEIRCAVNKMPETIEVDVSDLNIDDSISLAGLPLPEGAAVIGDPEQIAFIVSLPSMEVEEEEAEEEALLEGEEELEEPEVIGKGKTEEEEPEDNEQG
ncbi:MAG: 50S ribosomal protein L25 [Candidatus Pacebacteria bacterium]|nr:50S ribosomal protein L25 [Candidatus Paceibacterota bacterium]